MHLQGSRCLLLLACRLETHDRVGCVWKDELSRSRYYVAFLIIRIDDERLFLIRVGGRLRWHPASAHPLIGIFNRRLDRGDLLLRVVTINDGGLFNPADI